MTKKSISKKLNTFKTSPMISTIAIIEVILLICVSTFAWFVFAENNKADTDYISVEPDSGLEIDFNNADSSDYVNIWNYLEEFSFEPVTSLDGRNIFVPTTGTFNSTATTGITFREATVNDMNSKYINVDFTLTNTGAEDMDVYLSSKSYFKFNDSANGKALRLAFYQNDGSSGAVTSTLLSQQYDGDTPEDEEDPEDSGSSAASYLVYFDVTGSSWTDVWVEADFTSNAEGNTNKCLQMTKLDGSDTIYYIDLLGLLESNGTNSFTFMKFRSNPNNTTNETVSVELKNDNINPNTVYSFALQNGSAYVGSNSWGTGLMLADPVEYTGDVPDIAGDDDGDSGTDDTTSDDSTAEGQTTVYFNNTLGWEQPYAYIWQENGDSDVALSAWPGKPMTHISGSIYYYTFNSKYDSIIFNDGNSSGGAVKTGDIYPVQDGYIYMIGSQIGTNKYGWTVEDYIGSVDGGTYPVISPGVSTGFQRPYAPVTQIDDASGSASVVLPAFASSIDDYNYGSNKLFSIESGKTISLSMIVWLEGTDPDCTEDVYAGKYIDMNLVFATSGTGGEDMYTYKFLDKTKENWISDKVTTDTGVSFNPVMQLYDADNQKGYLMQLSSDGITWTVDAPQDLVNSEHIIFRRVNPMNEEEVWNYWETSGFGNLPDKTGVVKDSVVYFTAFSDGAPSNANPNTTTGAQSGAPAYSCGGLWGDHSTQLVTVYDGTKDQWIKNSDVDGYTSVLTMNYTYNGQTVEYKASGPDKDMYYFIVPNDVFSKENGSRPAITFKRYYNFDTKYALNSDKNDLTYHRSWSAGVCSGKFYEISEQISVTDSSQKTDYCYWGDDVLYVQAKEILKSKMDNAFMQVHFYASSDGTDTNGSDFYSYLYKNNNFMSDADDGYGYACVIPSDKEYYYYRVERCNTSDHSVKWNVTPLKTILQDTSTTVSYPNYVESNICSLENLYLSVYLECSTSYCGSSWDPECYMWDVDNTYGNAGDWPGTTMTWVSDTAEGGSTSYKQYVINVDVSRYDRLIFSNDYDNGDSRRQTGDITIGTDDQVSGMIYQWDASNSRWRSTYKSGVTSNETINAVLYNSPDWP